MVIMAAFASILQVLSSGPELFWEQFFIALLLFYILATVLASGWIANNLERFKKNSPVPVRVNKKKVCRDEN
jgi:hypothetical protein